MPRHWFVWEISQSFPGPEYMVCFKQQAGLYSQSSLWFWWLKKLEIGVTRYYSAWLQIFFFFFYINSFP